MSFFTKKIFLIFFVSVFFSPAFTHAASISLSPASGNFSPAQTFTVGLVVSTPDQAMNAVSGVLSFPADLLEVTSLSKGGSIVGLWVQEPSFSNNAGTVNFEGVALNPGFTGSSGRVLGVGFRVKRAGSAKLTFQTPSVLANDGQGTNILTNAGEANFNLSGETAPAPVPVISKTSNVLNISSPTHPNPDKWYKATTAKFVWDLPEGVSSLRLSVSKSAGEPSVVYDSPITEKEVSELEDGTWYLNAQYRTSAGWSEVAHFRFRVDSTAPSRFTLTEEKRQDQTDPKVKLFLDASDATSGIDYYEIRADNQSLPVWRGKRSEVYETPALAPGTHTITARALDRAGNALADSLEVKVEALLTPTWTDYPRALNGSEILVAKGRTYPNMGVVITWQSASDPLETTTVKSDESGVFTFTPSNKLSSGVYKITARALDDRGASSLESEAITIKVRPPAWWSLGVQAVTLLSLLIPLLALVVVLGFLLYYSYHRFHKLRRKLRVEVREVEESISKAFDALRDDMEKQLSLLEKAKTKRDLTREESRILTRVRKNLRTAEKYIKKEIEDIEKEVK